MPLELKWACISAGMGDLVTQNECVLKSTGSVVAGLFAVVALLLGSATIDIFTQIKTATNTPSILVQSMFHKPGCLERLQ